jgi:accessory colonization factor AcfC
MQSRLNIRRTTALSENICPKVLSTGIPVDYRNELQLAFGDYVKAFKGTTNTMTQQSSACIALHPAANSTGSWILWKIDTRSRVRRSNMVKLVTSKNIIKTVNAIAQEEAEEEQQPARLLENLVS